MNQSFTEYFAQVFPYFLIGLIVFIFLFIWYTTKYHSDDKKDDDDEYTGNGGYGGAGGMGSGDSNIDISYWD